MIIKEIETGKTKENTIGLDFLLTDSVFTPHYWDDSEDVFWSEGYQEVQACCNQLGPAVKWRCFKQNKRQYELANQKQNK